MLSAIEYILLQLKYRFAQNVSNFPISSMHVHHNMYLRAKHYYQFNMKLNVPGRLKSVNQVKSCLH